MKDKIRKLFEEYPDTDFLRGGITLLKLIDVIELKSWVKVDPKDIIIAHSQTCMSPNEINEKRMALSLRGEPHVVGYSYKRIAMHCPFTAQDFFEAYDALLFSIAGCELVDEYQRYVSEFRIENPQKIWTQEELEKGVDQDGCI